MPTAKLPPQETDSTKETQLAYLLVPLMLQMSFALKSLTLSPLELSASLLALSPSLQPLPSEGLAHKS